MPRPEGTSPITANSALSRAKSSPPTSSSPPQSPHRVRLPATPAAVSRPNPLENDRAGDYRRSGSEAPSSGSARVDSTAAAPSASQTTARQGVSRSTSSTSTRQDLEEKEKEKVPVKEDPIDMEIFGQILELDEDDPDLTFSRGIVENWNDQMDTTLTEIEKALASNDISTLSSRGHFLKGSSAALGVTGVRNACETMQYNGQLREDNGTGSIEVEEAIRRIKVLFEKVQVEYKDAKNWFEAYFEAEKKK